MMQSGESGSGAGQRLLEDFAVPDLDQWQQEVVRLLKGASFEKRMCSTTVEDLTIKPIYTRTDTADLQPPARPPIRWDVAQELPFADPGEFNRHLRHDLDRGQTAVNLVAGTTAIKTISDLDAALEGVDLERTPLYLQTGVAAPAVGQLFQDLCAGRGVNVIRVTGALGFDPLARHGELPETLAQAWDDLAQLTCWAAESAPDLRTVVVEGHLWHEAGAGAAEELAFSMASAVQALRELEGRSVEVEQAIRGAWFSFAVDTDFFTAIAKFRAARLLWSRIAGSCGAGASAARLVFHARSSGWSSTLFDPHTNILRTTTEAFAAIAGGCSSLHLAPFDERCGPPGERARRLARNTQLILRDESHFDRVADPAGGSWYVESLTGQLAKRAWELFQEIESGGGMARAVRDDLPRRMAAATAEMRRERLADRTDVLVGTNRYPLAGETPPESGVAPPSGLRGGSSFEELRIRVVKSGPPKVLLAAMGPPAGYMARLEFVRSFYQVGGFEVLGGGGFDSAGDVAAAVRKHHPAAVCIVSRDENYAELVPGLAAELLANHPDLVLHLAGGPPGEEQHFSEAGVRCRLTIRSNLLQVLTDLAEQTGVIS